MKHCPLQPRLEPGQPQECIGDQCAWWIGFANECAIPNWLKKIADSLNSIAYDMPQRE